MGYKIIDIKTAIRIIIHDIFQYNISKAKVQIIIPSLFHNKKVYESLIKENHISNLDYDNFPIKKYWELEYEIKDDFDSNNNIKEYENFFIDYSYRNKEKCSMGRFKVYYKILEQC